MVRLKFKSNILILCFVITGLFSQFALGAIPAKERTALIALYNATGGDNWKTNTNWKGNNNEADGFSQKGTEGTWYGVTVVNDHVTKIELDWNELSGSIPPELGDFGYLEFINLEYNISMGGSIPPELGNLGNLEYLNLGNLGLSGNIPPELGNLTNLKRLDLHSNELDGYIPSQLGNLAKLEYLALSSNQLAGSIPAILGNLLRLEGLSLYGNRYISGSIPPELGNLVNLKILNLSSCYNLSGGIPPELGNLGNLEFLSLAYNSLTGSIPSALGNLSKLRELNLLYNGLSGSIPTAITKLTNCTTINVRANALYTNDDAVQAFLDSRDKGWNFLQTLPPTNLSTVGLTASAVRVFWTPLNYTSDSGGYHVYYSTASAGPWTYAGKTSDKSKSHYDVSGLSFGPTYYFKVKTESQYYFNDFKVVSGYSSVVSGTPAAISPQIGLSSRQINFAHIKGTYYTGESQYFVVYPIVGSIYWTVSKVGNFFYAFSIAGLDTGIVRLSSQPQNLDPGEYTGSVTISDPNASNSPQTVKVTLKVYEEGQTSGPFGDFSTPLNNSTVRSSIPVTGWALDDVKVESVKIYREEAGKLVFVGDAAFVEGARPDVEQSYLDYPHNYRAGWGYMMLTNFLPNNGNGTFKIHAIARDREGNQTTLGVRTITCDNANAVKPFGAIDTPGQGDSISGDSYINWGWVLTPQPNSIPTDGSTIGVYVDGVFVGRPQYGIYREDIATFFPGYANSNGAVGYLHLDTVAYDNGVHNIYWTATDSGGNTDGIGSRYFTIHNSINNRSADNPSAAPTVNFSGNMQGQRSATGPLGIQKGYRKDRNPRQITCRDTGEFMTEIEELERLVITFPAGTTLINGYLEVAGELRSLPIGSHLDRKTGKLYWQPGPAYLGDYNLVFIERGRGGDIRTRNVVVRISPKTFE